jgi:hypothetical protein
VLYGTQAHQPAKTAGAQYETSTKTTPSSKHFHLKQSSAKPRSKKSSKSRTVSQELEDFVLIN